jgi:hypothetical protein
MRLERSALAVDGAAAAEKFGIGNEVTRDGGRLLAFGSWLLAGCRRSGRHRDLQSGCRCRRGDRLPNLKLMADSRRLRACRLSFRPHIAPERLIARDLVPVIFEIPLAMMAVERGLTAFGEFADAERLLDRDLAGREGYIGRVVERDRIAGSCPFRQDEADRLAARLRQAAIDEAIQQLNLALPSRSRPPSPAPAQSSPRRESRRALSPGSASPSSSRRDCRRYQARSALSHPVPSPIPLPARS